MRHIALRVSDIEKSARFYERAFGMRRFAVKRGAKFIALVSPGLRDQISLSSDSESEVGSIIGNVGEQGGVDHFGFVLSPGSRLDQAAERIQNCGGALVRHVEIAKGVPTVFFRDPDGYLFQIIRFPRFTRLYVAILPVLNWLRLKR